MLYTRKIRDWANPWLMGLALNDVPMRPESHFHERMLAAVTTLLFITILLWPLDKNFLPPGGKKACFFQRQCLCYLCLCGGCLQTQIGFKVEYLQLSSAWQNGIVGTAWELFTNPWVLISQERAWVREGLTPNLTAQPGGELDGSEATRETEATKLLVNKTEVLFNLFCSHLTC